MILFKSPSDKVLEVLKDIRFWLVLIFFVEVITGMLEVIK